MSKEKNNQFEQPLTEDSAVMSDSVSECESAAETLSAADPFEDSPDDAADLSEVVARDERNATLPAKEISSVAQALEQRPPRLAQPKRGPRTEMLESLIPEVIIPTDTLETRGFARVKVVESSKLEELKAIAEEQESSAAEGAESKAEASSESASSSQGEPDSDSKPVERDPGVVVREGSKRPNVRGAVAGQRKAASAKGKRKLHRPTPLQAGMGILGAILLCFVVAGGLFTWDYWFRYDDTQDILGEWKMTNAERTMVITEKSIKITDSVSYDYSLDTKAKTITYSFGGDSMVASYRFSSDRQCLVIDESCDTEWLVAMHLKEDPVLADRDVPKGISKLEKLSDDTEADPKNTEEVLEDQGGWTSIAWVDGYYDYPRPKIESSQDDEESSKKKNSSKKNSNSSDSSSDENGDENDSASDDENDDGAVYVDEETGMRYYYDSEQMLYYDSAGNYYYDMYGNNPYIAYTDDAGYY